jgi:guanosine-3',5'-bis(diphosphate) 3'-pyrophosphohydrolase
MSDPNARIFEAASFAARAHRHQLRKDRETPYFSHPARVCLVVRQLFGFADPNMLAAALLHDTLEDTSTDCDDLIERFGQPVASWVAALSKDCRLPHDNREEAYARTLARADWQVRVLKLADLYDNLSDSLNVSVDQRRKTIQKTHFYLAALRDNLPPEAATALRLVEARLAELESSLTT